MSDYEEKDRSVTGMTPEEKHRMEHLEAAKGRINGDAEPYNRPAHYIEIDPKAEARLRRKIDVRLVPFCTLLYLLNYIDRAAIGNARVAGFEKDVGIAGNTLNLGLTVFYIFYIIVELPSNMIFQRLGSMYLAFLVIGFGVVSIATAFIHNEAGFYCTRVFLGIFEGGVLPGIAFLLSRYYTRQELIARIGFFLALSPSLSGAFGGLLASGFLASSDVGSVRSWRKIFLWEGVITTVVGIIAIFLLPTWPEKTRMFNEEERRIALARIRNEDHSDSNTEKDKMPFWMAFKQAFSVHSILCIIGYSCINVSVAGLSTFMPTVIRTLGRYTTIEVQLRTVPPFVVAAVWSVVITYISWKVQKRGIFIMISIPMAILGYIFFVASLNPKLRYAGCFLCFTGVVPLGPYFLSWGLNNMPNAQPRSYLSALIPSLGTIGSVVSTWTYTSNFSPRYLPGNSINVATTCLVFVIGAFLTWYVKWENKRRDRGDLDHRIEGLSEQEQQRLGYKHPAFRYLD